MDSASLAFKLSRRVAPSRMGRCNRRQWGHVIVARQTSTRCRAPASGSAGSRGSHAAATARHTSGRRESRNPSSTCPYLSSRTTSYSSLDADAQHAGFRRPRSGCFNPRRIRVAGEPRAHRRAVGPRPGERSTRCSSAEVLGDDSRQAAVLSPRATIRDRGAVVLDRALLDPGRLGDDYDDDQGPLDCDDGCTAIGASITTGPRRPPTGGSGCLTGQLVDRDRAEVIVASRGVAATRAECSCATLRARGRAHVEIDRCAGCSSAEARVDCDDGTVLAAGEHDCGRRARAARRARAKCWQGRDGAAAA